ncbi:MULTISPECIES: 3'-5' exonuclease [unclassified Agarivorans]|uniref:3'-5' exonuclease n=1 Tax=unclassified Agarivorans TaxID=2636026 RepID=UPI0026E202B3|nr:MULTISPECIES: 3'-5' exonuclease [unclassified Agarivorans]MDO6686434.1 3'-5' exonuclease [Agarivorans sp. 3_MG-2023]MDO6713736.1 3'-5' exonuclease [Agarivorans sp. 2_MG-2023]
MFTRFKPLAKLGRARAKVIASGGLPKKFNRLLEATLPSESSNIKDLEFLAFDLETTGLHPENDHILSIGYTVMKNLSIDLNSASHCYINSGNKVKAETAVINQIVPEMLAQGISLDQAMDQLFEAMQGRVLLVHGCCVEQQFIDYYLKQRYQLNTLPLVWVDTLSLEKSLIANANHQKTGDFRLSAIRQRYGLPEYNGHNALMDAVATGELFLAQTKRIFAKSPQVIGSLIKK